MTEESNPGSASVDREWINKILEILLLNTSVEKHEPTKKRFFEIAFQMFHEGSFYAENNAEGSIYLGNFLTEDGYFDFSYLESVIRMAVRFMDNELILRDREDSTDLITINLTGFDDVFDMEKTTTDEGKDKTYSNLTFFTMREALKSSMELAQERGATTDWQFVLGDMADRFKLEKKPVRNSVVVYAISAPKLNFEKSDLT
ncbi:MAG: hypothetical protein ACXAC2_00625 [Candidatus Kariarchaeaceae archaeon]|jgi:hypothetical protein